TPSCRPTTASTAPSGATTATGRRTSTRTGARSARRPAAAVPGRSARRSSTARPRSAPAVSRATPGRAAAATPEPLSASVVVARRRALALDRVLDAFHPAVAPRAGLDEPDLLEHADRRGVLDDRVGEDAAVAEHLERVLHQRLGTLGGVAE